MTKVSATDQQNQFRQDFIAFAIEKAVLKFGEFETKAGRLSPYFFNAGLFNDGESLLKLGEYYADAITEADLEFDLIFGPAYKGITLAASIAIAFAKRGRNVPYAYNRKEAKDHGEGGVIVGSAIQGKVLIVDDVISAGTSVRESVTMIEQHNAQVSGVAIAIDRQEKGQGERSAVQEVIATTNVPVCAIANLDNLIEYIKTQQQYQLDSAMLQKMQAYRERYGVV